MKAILTAALLTAATVTTALAGAGHSDDLRLYGEPGTPDHPAKTVVVKMSETDSGMAFSPDRIVIHKGEQIRFVITNSGEFDHEFVLATVEENLEHAAEMAKNPDMEHDDPNAIRLTPNSKGEILWMFSNAGEFDFSCLLPGHRESGMFGTVIVQSSSALAATTPILGEVKKINLEQNKITLKHEPISNLDMKAMTMVFVVADPAMLEIIKVGDMVTFEADRVKGKLTIISLKVQ